MSKKVSAPTPVGIWIRVSTEHQAGGDSPETHEVRARAYAQAKGWEVVEVYRLAGVSGKNVRSHAECQRMLADVQAGKIQALIFSKLARLARSTRDLLDFADYFKEHEVSMVSLDQSIDTSTHVGQLFYTFMAALAEFERQEISSRVKAAVATRAKMGKPLGGRTPFGYHWVDKKLVPHPEEAPVRALMYELFLANPRVNALVRELTERGYTNRGKKWHNSTVRSYLTDSIAKGLRRVNYTYQNAKTGTPHLKPEEEWTYVEVEPIVSEELWGQVNAILAERAEKREKRPGRKSRHLFTGLVRCACGTKMYVPSRVTDYRCKACSNSITAEDLEAIFMAKLKEWLTPETVVSILLQSDQLVQTRKLRRDSVASQLSKAEAEVQQLLQLHSSGEIPTEGFRSHYQPLHDRCMQLREELARTQGELDCFSIELLSEAQALEKAKGLVAHLEEGSLELKRQALEALVKEIEVGKGEVVLSLNYFPFPSHVSPTSVGTGRGRARDGDGRGRGSDPGGSTP